MPVTIRSLAALCGVSTATVSRALAGNENVQPETRRRIVEIAAREGYARNQLVGALMAHIRGARSQTFLGNLALLHIPGPGQTRPGTQQRRIISGAQARARALGYQLYLLSLADKDTSLEAIVRIMRARGVLGVVFLYTLPLETPLEFPWKEFVVLEIDYGLREPTLHTVCHDHFSSLTRSLLRLREAGYQRAGLFIENFKDARTNFRWSAAFRSFQERHGGIGELPILSVPEMTEKAFLDWYRTQRPDVVIGHFDRCIEWLRAIDHRVPKDVGFFSLNYQGRTVPCAGIDPRLELQGSVAVESLIAQVQRSERGLPEVPQNLMVPGQVVDGPTIKTPGTKRRTAKS